MKHGTYDKLKGDGLIASGTGVTGEDTIIGKTAPLPPDNEELGQRTRTQIRVWSSHSRHQQHWSDAEDAI
jgi:DNA-directed RNA polymerase II subunit RPB2